MACAREGSAWDAATLGLARSADRRDRPGDHFGIVAVTLGALVLGYGCGGSDVSAPSDNRLCNTAAETPIGLAMAVVAVGGPLYGTVAATHYRSLRPLVLGTLVGLLGMVSFLAAFSLRAVSGLFGLR